MDLIVFLSGNGNGIRLAILLAPFVVPFVLAGGFYMHVWNKYRNTDKSYSYETTTAVELSNVDGYDSYAYNLDRTRESGIDGAGRSSDPRQRL